MINVNFSIEDKHITRATVPVIPRIGDTLMLFQLTHETDQYHGKFKVVDVIWDIWVMYCQPDTMAVNIILETADV